MENNELQFKLAKEFYEDGKEKYNFNEISDNEKNAYVRLLERGILKKSDLNYKKFESLEITNTTKSFIESGKTHWEVKHEKKLEEKIQETIKEIIKEITEKRKKEKKKKFPLLRKTMR